jgi:hypothetical protein
LYISIRVPALTIVTSGRSRASQARTSGSSSEGKEMTRCVSRAVPLIETPSDEESVLAKSSSERVVECRVSFKWPLSPRP